MKLVLIFAMFANVFCDAGSSAIAAVESGDRLQYDDGEPEWLALEGTWRGTWFRATDFCPEAQGFLLGGAEILLYTDPGDIDLFTLSVHSGGPAGPGDLMYDTTIVAQLMQEPVIVFPESLQTDTDFWLVLHSQSTEGATVPLLGDGTPNSTSHSFYSMDFIQWEPWVVEGPSANDYFIRATGSFLPDQPLEHRTWASVKSTVAE